MQSYGERGRKCERFFYCTLGTDDMAAPVIWLQQAFVWCLTSCYTFPHHVALVAELRGGSQNFLFVMKGRQ